VGIACISFSAELLDSLLKTSVLSFLLFVLGLKGGKILLKNGILSLELFILSHQIFDDNLFVTGVVLLMLSGRCTFNCRLSRFGQSCHFVRT